MLRVTLLFLAISILSCNYKKFPLDCSVDKVTIQSKKFPKMITDSVRIRRITRALELRKRVTLKFKPEHWLEISGAGSDCDLKIGVSDKYIKVEGETYILKENLEQIVSEYIKK